MWKVIFAFFQEFFGGLQDAKRNVEVDEHIIEVNKDAQALLDSMDDRQRDAVLKRLYKNRRHHDNKRG